MVEQYVEYSRDLPSPYVFRLWAAIHAVGAAAERRIWTQFGLNKLHPNLFVFLVGPPGVGKSQAINPMSTLLRKSQAVELAPNDMTKQGLLDILGDCARGAIVDGRPFDYHFLAICVSELSNFIPQYDRALAGILTDLFDCPPVNDEKKRGHDKGKLIPFPGISMLVGTATQNLGNTITQDMWGSGFMARVIMVFSADEVRIPDRFKKVVISEALEDQIVTGLRHVGEMKGEMQWEPGAYEALNFFSHNQKIGAPLHNRLVFYVTRRWLHLAKLCMIAALANQRMTVTYADFDIALQWLLAAEREMPEIFKDMVSHEDGQIFEEMRSQMFALYMKAHEPISAPLLYAFLSKRVSSYSIPRMIEVAVSAGYFDRVAGTEGDDALYIPRMTSAATPGTI